MRIGHLRWAPFTLAVILLSAVNASPQSSPLAPAPPLSDPEGVFRALVTRYYEAWGRKDLPALEGMWHPTGPARSTRNIAEVEFELHTLKLVGLALKDVRANAGGGHARALIDLDITDDKTGLKRRARRVRDFSFLPDGETWKIWNENADQVGVRIATRLLDATKAEAAALIASDPEVRSDDALSGLGLHVTRLRTQGKLGDVLEALRLQGDLARAIGNEVALATSLQDAGLVHQVMGSHDEAARAFAAARDLFARVGTKEQLAAAEGNVGAADYVRGDYASAAERYQKALALREELRDAPRTASTLHSLGNALYMLGDFERAMASYQRSLSLHEAAKDKLSASSVEQAIGLVHKELGSYAAAIEAFAKSARWSTEANDIVGAARAEQGLGDLYRLVGDYTRSLQHLAAGLALWEKTTDGRNRASTMFATGQVYALQKDFGQAVEWYQRALDLDQQIGEQPGVARDYGGLGGAHAGAGKIEIALEEHRKSLEIRERLKDVPGVMWTTVHLGVLLTALSQHSEALEAYQKSLTIAEAQGDARAVATILALRSANELAREDVDAALASSQTAAEIAGRQELFDALAYAKVVTGKAHRRAGRMTEAQAALEEAVETIDRVPVGPGVETFFDDRRGPYAALIDLLASVNRPADAFRYAERARTHAIALLLGGDGASVVKGLSAEERDEERRLGADARTLNVRLQRERGKARPDPDRAAAIRAQIDSLKSQRDAFRRTLFERHPGLAALRAQTEPLAAESAGAILGASEALLSFTVTEARTHLLLIAGGTEAGRVVKAAAIDVKAGDLAGRIVALRTAIEKRDAEASALSRALYSLLIEPVRSDIRPFRRLVIVPDALLWGLPFEALQNTAGRYLVQDYAVGYAPSLTALAAMRSAGPNGNAGKAGAIAPAVARPSAKPSLVAAADPAISARAQDRLALLGVEKEAPGTPATRELRSLSMLFGPAASQAFVRQDARVDRVVAASRPAGALHLAVPAYLVDASPLFSIIAMSPAGAQDEDQGLVEIGDALAWTLPTDLVVLPHLKTPAATTGDGLVALAWSLFVAGSPTTVASRWVPAKGGNAPSVRAFYRAWVTRSTPRAEPATPSAAMQSAARALIAQPDTHPADWANLMVIGR